MIKDESGAGACTRAESMTSHLEMGDTGGMLRAPF